MRILYDSDAIQAKVRELADHLGNGDSVLLCPLDGALPFFIDVIRHLENPSMHFVRMKSYEGTKSTGEVTIKDSFGASLAGKEVTVIEDLIDTGLSMQALLSWLKDQGVSSVRVCALLDKPSRREVSVEIDWVGFTIEDFFIVGYGMDHDGRFRDLDHIAILE